MNGNVGLLGLQNERICVPMDRSAGLFAERSQIYLRRVLSGR